jgi:hypothetical protein
MIRFITKRRLARILGANVRHEQRHVLDVRRISDLERDGEAAAEREGRLRADLRMLRQTLAEHPEYRSVRAEITSALNRCAALDALLSDLQSANEGAYRDALAARLEVNPYKPAKQVTR